MAFPFSKVPDRPGHGIIAVSMLPPATPILQTLSYQYPLKLIAPSPIDLTPDVPSPPFIPSNKPSIVHTVFILTYGGGLLPNDHISLHVSIASEARLVLLTQGSTKIFKSAPASSPNPPNSSLSSHQGSSQGMTVDIEDGAALCYLPDPIQPFSDSAFEQYQTFNLTGKASGSVCVCDWVCEGRPARGESWGFQHYMSVNEIWISCPPTAIESQDEEMSKRLMIRDKLVLDQRGSVDMDFRSKVDKMGVVGTLILRGNLFRNLGQFFLNEFRQSPRIGGKVWEGDVREETDRETLDRKARHEREVTDGLLWTVAASRGNVIVKFGACNAEGARNWLAHMLKREGTIERAFGERALLCLR